MAVEDRSTKYQDMVSNNNALLGRHAAQGASGKNTQDREIRETLEIAKRVVRWYSGYDQLLSPAIDLFNDAVWDPKVVVVPIILSMREILNNQGEP